MALEVHIPYGHIHLTKLSIPRFAGRSGDKGIVATVVRASASATDALVAKLVKGFDVSGQRTRVLTTYASRHAAACGSRSKDIGNLGLAP